MGNLGITANNFINNGGSITADTLTLSVAGDFDYALTFKTMEILTLNKPKLHCKKW